MVDSTSILKLRDRTGCNLKDCKDALTWAEGNEDFAVDILISKHFFINEGYLWVVAKESYERKQKK